MLADNLNRWLTLGANFGVVVGLIVLIYEVNQNTAMMEAQINQQRTDTAMSEQQSQYNSDYLPAIVLKAGRAAPLTEEEHYRFSLWMRAFNRNMDNQLWQYNHGFLGENIPRSMRYAVRNVIGTTEAGLEVWEESKGQYSDEYIEFVDGTIADLR